MLVRALVVATLLLFQPQPSRPADFPTSTKSPEARASFISGLAWLHNFGYDEALDEFRKSQAIDPTFAMAYWGEAMCHYRPVWRIEDAVAGRAALAKLGGSRAERAGQSRQRSRARVLGGG